MAFVKESTPNITFVIQDIEGGVASMNHQIIENANFRSYFRVHIILWRAFEQKNKSFNSKFQKADTVSHFNFSKFDNYFLTLKRFNAALNEQPGLLVTNDGFELEAVRKFGSKSVVYSIIHDFYNFKLAIENLHLIDYFICHTDAYFRPLASNPLLRDRTVFLLHGVKQPVSWKPRETNKGGKLRVASLSRLIESKGVLLYFDINEMLLESNVEVEWVIIGSGELRDDIKNQWEKKENIELFTPDTREEVYEILESCDVFISPSIFEGYGIALLEAMTCGLVPVIYQLPIGVYSDLPTEAGFSITQGNIEGFAKVITRLDRDRELLIKMSNTARQLVLEKYDIGKTADQYLDFFNKNRSPKVDRKIIRKNYNKTSILDTPFMPNSISKVIKKWRLGL